MPQQTPKLNPKWVKQTRDYFLEFLEVTEFPHPERNGSRGSKFDYPEWLIIDLLQNNPRFTPVLPEILIK
jgi:hypothetical protein